MSRQTAKKLIEKLTARQQKIFFKYLDALSKKDLNGMIEATEGMTKNDVQAFTKIITELHDTDDLLLRGFNEYYR